MMEMPVTELWGAVWGQTQAALCPAPLYKAHAYVK